MNESHTNELIYFEKQTKMKNCVNKPSKNVTLQNVTLKKKKLFRVVVMKSDHNYYNYYEFN